MVRAPFFYPASVYIRIARTKSAEPIGRRPVVHGPITGEQNQEATMAVPQGVISASLIVMIVAAALGGAGGGGMIGPNIDPAVLAVTCGFVATLCAVLLRNQLLHR